MAIETDIPRNILEDFADLSAMRGGRQFKLGFDVAIQLIHENLPQVKYMLESDLLVHSAIHQYPMARVNDYRDADQYDEIKHRLEMNEIWDKKEKDIIKDFFLNNIAIRPHK